QVDVLPSYWGQNLLISRTSNREQSARVMKLVGIRKSKLVTNYPNNERQYCALRPRLRPVNCLLANNQLAPNDKWLIGKQRHAIFGIRETLAVSSGFANDLSLLQNWIFTLRANDQPYIKANIQGWGTACIGKFPSHNYACAIRSIFETI